MTCIHLSRYRRAAGGSLCKDIQSLPDCFDTVRIPVFSEPDSLHVQWQPYKVCAMALHYDRGHYRVLACQWQNCPPFHQSIWLTDDNRPAQLISLADASALSQLAYVI